MDKQHNQSSNILKDDGVPHSVSHLLEYDLMHQDESASYAVLTGVEAAKAAHAAAIEGRIDKRCARGRLSNCGDCPLGIDPKSCANSPFYDDANCGALCDCTVNPQASPGQSFYGRASKSEEAQHIDEQGDYFKPWLQSYPQGVPEFVNTHEFENLVELFHHSVERFGDNVAFVNMGSQLTFKQVDELSSNFAAFLQVKLGLKSGEKIAIMMPNIMQFPIAFFGSLKAGLTVININPLYTPRELQAQLENSDATSIVVIANYANSLEQIIDETYIKNVIITEVGDAFNDWLGLKRWVINNAVRFKGMVPHLDRSRFAFCTTFIKALKSGAQVKSDFRAPKINYHDIALLQYTGGTTGKSKGAMLSHGNILSNIAQAYGMYGQVLKVGQETILTVIPLYHIFALTVNLVLFTYLGSKNLLITDPRNLKSFVKDLRNHPEITAMTGVNTLFNLFVNNEEFTDLKWEHLHLVVGGGAAVQSGVEQRFYEKTGFHILEGYGLTECSPLCSVCPFTVDHYTGSIGLVVPSTIARIVDADGHEIRDLEHEGELEIKGPQVMQGYYKCDKHNDFIFDDGFVRTGDIAKWMEGGYIKLIDRLKDMILVSGFNVFPNEIEDVVSRFSRVMECAVIGIPSDSTGEAVKLFVVKKDPSLSSKEVKQYCRAYLTPYKVPRVIQFVESLPKSPLGKVLRRKLRDMEGKVPLSAEQQLENIKLQEQKEAQERKMQQELQKAYEHDQAQSHSAQKVASLIDASAIAPQDSDKHYAPELDYHKKEHSSAMDNAVLHAFSSHTAAGTTIKTDYKHYEQTLEANKHHRKAVNTRADDSNLSQEQWQRLEGALKAHHVEDESVEQDSLVPKSKGAMALERLLSSHGIDALDAAIATPNIHHQDQKSSLVRGPKHSRIHVGDIEHDKELDH